MYYHISLGVKHVKTICIEGIEYINDDYIYSKYIKLGVPYIKAIKFDGVEYINLDYKEPIKHIKNYRGKSFI